MASPGRWTTEQETRLRELHGQGLTLTAIAKELGRDKGSVSRKAKAMDPPLTWDRSHTAAATQAKVLDVKARRAQLKADLLEDAARLRKQLFAPTVIFNFGGKDNTYEQRELDQPPHADQLKIMQAVSTAIGSYDRLEKLDGDGGVSDAVGMLDKIADAIKATAQTLQDAP
ncbi:helix-turn-helix domain-containing protein [Ornithinimicrobium sufpigmenti]|uniref:helix-turn-helix domain-containing protein n=1 Tax=Ornithinimicrobium sufpigmenti TaxID=2508882 RepID=UPI0010358F98|nr:MULTISPECIES: helix-turn-helix domain-containing protein [unclassified Ornithinimicrobium]